MELKRRLLDLKSRLDAISWTKNRILAAVLGGTFLLVVLAVVLAPSPQKKDILEVAWPVTTLPAKPELHSPQLSLFGKVETPRVSTMSAAISAHVIDVPASEGAFVKQGDLLIMLDEIDLRLLVQQRQADVTEVHANFESLLLTADENRARLTHEQRLYELAINKSERHKALRKQKSISEESLNSVLSETHRQAIALSNHEKTVADIDNELARAKASIQRAEALHREAVVRLGRTKITAPFDGRITQVTVSPGEHVSQGTLVVEMYDTNDMEVRAQIPSRNLAVIKLAMNDGTAVTGQIDVEGLSLPVTLARLSGAVSRGSSSVEGLFRIDSDYTPELGRAVNLTLTLPTVADTILVPIQSLYGQNQVFVVEDEHLKAVQIERIGERKDDQGHPSVLIRAEQIIPGTLIVTSQLSNAITGLKVEVQPGTEVAELAQLPRGSGSE